MSTQQIDEEFLKILACPQCHGEFKLEGDWLLCQGECKRKYPIKNGIPMLRLEDGLPAEGE
jgi:hypothetical protein